MTLSDSNADQCLLTPIPAGRCPTCGRVFHKHRPSCHAWVYVAHTEKRRCRCARCGVLREFRPHENPARERKVRKLVAHYLPVGGATWREINPPCVVEKT